MPGRYVAGRVTAVQAQTAVDDMPSLMIQGCGSDVGKTVLVAGLCRLLANRGWRVRPFKPQNMSNNAAVTPDGGEVGRSTALQALACRVAPSVDMNPILLKPQSDLGAQLIVRGRRMGTFQARAHGATKRELLDIALASYRALERDTDWIVVEGAGSPAETNLREHDIANMGFAHAADLPVVLVGDINRGHVIAALVGAHTVLADADRARVRGFIINKFRGDLALFDEGLATIARRTGWPSLGVVPWLSDAMLLPEEDAVSLETPLAAAHGKRRVRIAVVRLKHIANFDDFDPLLHEPDVDLQFVSPLDPLPLDIDLLIIPGSKATIADIEVLRESGWEHDLHAYVRRGGRVLGICAGYQMLGRRVRDPLRIEGARESIAGFGLLDVTTDMTPDKLLREVAGVEARSGARFRGYEMHVGRTIGPAAAHPMLRFDDGSTDGAVHSSQRVMGCHVHGLVEAPEYRAALLSELGANSSGFEARARIDGALDGIAAVLEARLDIERLIAIA
jgi:adenosylcobyric acid synthase